MGTGRWALAASLTPSARRPRPNLPHRWPIRGFENPGCTRFGRWSRLGRGSFRQRHSGTNSLPYCLHRGTNPETASLSGRPAPKEKWIATDSIRSTQHQRTCNRFEKTHAFYTEHPGTSPRSPSADRTEFRKRSSLQLHISDIVATTLSDSFVMSSFLPGFATWLMRFLLCFTIRD